MAHRSMYLAKYGGSRSQRAHFAIFIPNADCDRSNLVQDFRSKSCKGTIVHVVGEPVMSGYVLEIKRNYECSTSQDLKKLVLLGHVDTANIHEPTSKSYVKEYTTRGILEGHAATIVPPPRGQNVRAPIDGVNTKRCQEWTMELLARLADMSIIDPAAISIAQEERDSPTHGIFGYRKQT